VEVSTLEVTSILHLRDWRTPNTSHTDVELHIMSHQRLKHRTALFYALLLILYRTSW
jgi:hypothetical protein